MFDPELVHSPFIFFCAKQGEQFQLASDNDAGRDVIKGLHPSCASLKVLNNHGDNSGNDEVITCLGGSTE